MFRHTFGIACLLLALTPAAIATPAVAPPFQLAAADGVDFRDQEYTIKASSRTGHAAFTPQELKAALADLPKDQQIAIRAISAKLDKTTQEQLAALIAKSRVQYKDATGKTLIDNLWALVDRPLQHQIKNADLMREIIRDVARPSTIAQANHGTCTSTSIQSALARTAPAEYARILAGLAGGDGVVTCRDGKTKLSSALYIPYKDRTVTGNLFQPACMDAQARNNGYRYDNQKDHNVRKKDGQTYRGSRIIDVAALQTAILVGHYETFNVADVPKKKVAKVLASATTKTPVLVCMSTAGGGAHEVQLVGYDKGKKAYKIRNPWGETVYVPRADVDSHMTGVNHRVE